MVRMTDLLKKLIEKTQAEREEAASKRKDSAEETSPGNEKAEERDADKGETPGEKRSHQKGAVEFSKMFSAPGEGLETGGHAPEFMKNVIPPEEDTKKLYSDAIKIVKDVFTAYKQGTEIARDDILGLANKIVNSVLTGSGALLKLFHEQDSPDFYIYHSAVNVAILSAEMGIAFNYNKSKMLDLAILGLLHDMDLIKSEDIIKKPSKLTDEEIKKIKKHPLNAAAMADSVLKLNKDIVNAILHHHERAGGQGYPAGLTEREINELGMILSVASSYEAMTHTRPYKEKMSSHETVMDMIKYGKEYFSNVAIKALVSRVGLYPVGSWIELNTGEFCKVIEVNHDYPMRPMIAIVMDKNKNKFDDIRTIDLRKVPSLYIEKPVKDMAG